jgi:hypothetical protein
MFSQHLGIHLCEIKTDQWLTLNIISIKLIKRIKDADKAKNKAYTKDII